MNNWFGIALTLSISIHIAVLGVAALNAFRFHKDRQIKKEIQTEFTRIKPLEEKKVDIDKDFIFKEPPPYMDLKNQLVNLRKDNKPKLSKPEINDVKMAKHKVVFNKPTESLDSIPAYINYYEKIRNKIRNTAYSSYRSDISGKIFLNFTVNQNGTLNSIYIDQEESVNSDYLKNIAINSIRNSAPFPEFPKDLKRFQNLNFNLSIHFKRN